MALWCVSSFKDEKVNGDLPLSTPPAIRRTDHKATTEELRRVWECVASNGVPAQITGGSSLWLVIWIAIPSPTHFMAGYVKNKFRCYPQQLESVCIFAIKSADAIKIKCLRHKKHWNSLEFHKASAPEPSRTSQGICTRTLRNLTKHLLCQNPPEPHKVAAPEPSGTAGIFTGTSEPHEVSAPEPSGTWWGICTRAIRNLVRNLVLKLHRIAPELIWAKDPIAKFCCGGKKSTLQWAHGTVRHPLMFPLWARLFVECPLQYIRDYSSPATDADGVLWVLFIP